MTIDSQGVYRLPSSSPFGNSGLAFEFKTQTDLTDKLKPVEIALITPLNMITNEGIVRELRNNPDSRLFTTSKKD